MSSYHEKGNRTMINKHRRTVAKWKASRNIVDRLEANSLKKQIKKTH